MAKEHQGPVERFRAGLLRLIEYVAAALLAGIMLMTIVDVVARYLFRRPIAASFELTEMAMQVMIYLCIAVAMANNDHIRVTLIDPLLARVPRVERLLDRMFGVVMAVALGGLGIAATELARGKVGDVTAVLGLPIAPVAWGIGLALCLAALLAVWALIRPPAATGGADD